MSRSGYSDECENIELYRRAVENAIKGKRGQAFLREMAKALDEMPEKKLIADELVSNEGVCAIGAVCKARCLDVSEIDYDNPDSVARVVGISRSMAAEIEYMNDEAYRDAYYYRGTETPEQRWIRMRQWVQENLIGGQ